MATERETQLVFFNPAAIVTNTDQFSAALFDININAASARVEAILYQLFHHGRRAFHYLSGSNLVG